MRIDRLHIENFKKFVAQDFELHPNFTLLVGENGSGKTSVLDALAIAAGIWLVEPPDSMLDNSGRNIAATEIHLEAQGRGDRVQFQERLPVIVRTTGQIGGRENIEWARRIRDDTKSKGTYNYEAKEALAKIKEIYLRDREGEHILCPVLAYYGAGRAWIRSNERVPKAKSNGPARRWAAFYDCFNERIRFADLQRWFLAETIERGNHGGKWRPGFEAVRRAVLDCMPRADDIWYSTDREQIVLSIEGNPQPFDNLSAGQRMMLALIADLAIKAVTQNAFLLPADELGPEDDPLPRVLRQTPGLVLIDELDVHLHPKWQRRVIEDLRRTFPAIQFVATTHSPFLIQTLRPGELISLDQAQAAEYAGRGVEEVARYTMGVESPEMSPRYREMLEAAREYFEVLKEGEGADEQKKGDLKKQLENLTAPYADNPAYQALLEQKRQAAGL